MEPNNQINELPAEPASLKEAYPMPRYSIKDAVMAQIAAERAGEAKNEPHEETKILTFREKIRKNYKNISRYGSLAACAVLILGVLAIASPLMKQGKFSAEQDCAACEEAGNAEAAYNGNELADTLYYSMYDASGADYEAEEKRSVSTEAVHDDSVVYATGSTYGETTAPMENSTMSTQTTVRGDTGAVTQAATEAVMEAATEAAEAATRAETRAETECSAAESAEAEADDVTAEQIKAIVADAIIPNDYSAWMVSNSYTGYEDYSLAKLVLDFDIDRDVLTDVLGVHAENVNMDILYGGDAADALADAAAPEVLDDMVIEE